MKIIPEEDKQKAIRLYKAKYKMTEIANLTGMSETTIIKTFRKEFAEGNLKPRHSWAALKPRTPNGQGKKYVPTGVGHGGRSKERKKFTDEQEAQIAEEYYVHNVTWKDIKEKWGIHPMQMQRIRNKYAPLYPPKLTGYRSHRNNKIEQKGAEEQ